MQLQRLQFVPNKDAFEQTLDMVREDRRLIKTHTR